MRSNCRQTLSFLKCAMQNRFSYVDLKIKAGVLSLLQHLVAEGVITKFFIHGWYVRVFWLPEQCCRAKQLYIVTGDRYRNWYNVKYFKFSGDTIRWIGIDSTGIFIRSCSDKWFGAFHILGYLRAGAALSK